MVELIQMILECEQENGWHLSNWHWIKKSSWNPKVITVFSRAQQLSLSWASRILSKPSHPISMIHFSIILPHRLTCSTQSLSVRFPTKHCMHLCSAPHMPHTLPISLFLIWWPKYITMYLCDHYECHVHRMQDHSSKIFAAWPAEVRSSQWYRNNTLRHFEP
jgi:hypothetical protein